MSSPFSDYSTTFDFALTDTKDSDEEHVPLTPSNNNNTSRTYHNNNVHIHRTQSTTSYLQFFRSPSALELNSYPRPRRSVDSASTIEASTHGVLFAHNLQQLSEDSEDSTQISYLPSQHAVRPPSLGPAMYKKESSQLSLASHQSSNSQLLGVELAGSDSLDNAVVDYPWSPTGTTTSLRSNFSRPRNLHWSVSRTIAQPFISAWRNITIRQPNAQRLPMSPRSRNLQNLKFLQSLHHAKVSTMQLINDSNGKNGNQQVDDDSYYYDFCLVLTPQQVYLFWAELLDFRTECLGPEEEEESNNLMTNGEDDKVVAKTVSIQSDASIKSILGEAPDKENSVNSLEAALSPHTPRTGLYQRRSRHETVESALDLIKSDKVPPASAISKQSTCYSLVGGTRPTTVKKRNVNMSIFERAAYNGNDEKDGIQSSHRKLVGSSSKSLYKQDSSSLLLTNKSAQKKKPVGSTLSKAADANTTPTPLQQRRRWGNHNAGRVNLMSPPIRSLTRGTNGYTPHQTLPSTTKQQTNTLKSTNTIPDKQNPHSQQQTHVLQLNEIPNPVIPRGIAARTNGLLQFLSALKRGIVVRKHRPKLPPILGRIYSHNGGDTICFQHIELPEALNALREQRVRYNSKTDDVYIPTWAHEYDSSSSDPNQQGNTHAKFTIPDYVAAQRYREQMHPSLKKQIQQVAKHFAEKQTLNVGDVIAVHPSQHFDPRSTCSEKGTCTLRKSVADYAPHHTFSLVFKRGRPGVKNGKSAQSQAFLDDWEQKWYKNEGSDVPFKYWDLEAASPGEYWLLLRGLLLLHRDAAVGRFAEHRAAGIGSHYRRLELQQREQLDLEAHNRLHDDEFREPVTVGCLEKMIVKCRDLDTTYMEGSTLPTAVPPPSDYFLGFKSPGTSIWSRLRQAGLETKRVYSLDPRRVMIKIRCPNDRLIDVAEVLRIKLKTRDGTFAPFREDIMDRFFTNSDPLDVSPASLRDTDCFHFRSAIRQAIINFIIGSRIRDSGAELGQTTDLGKMIAARVPLHMHGKVDAIYFTWVKFWKVENWQGRDGRSMSHEGSGKVSTSTSKDAEFKDLEKQDTVTSADSSENDDDDDEQKDRPMPGLFRRLMMGCMHQPLDSVEQYFGEKVAFYFAWLQHTAAHLVFLTVAGLIMFIIQLGSGQWDHPLRPFYSVVVMLWTFTVLVNWRKRANFLAYRWGTMDYKEQEVTRPQFQGDYTRDEITGEWVVTYPKWKRWLKYSISFPLTLFFTGGSLLLILWVHANRDLQLADYLLQRSIDKTSKFQFEFAISAIGKKAPITDVDLTRDHYSDPNFWLLTIGLPSALGLCLPLLNFVLMRLSIILNDFENYRTESEYRTHLIIKVFSFRFVCYFATLYYYAFVSVGSDKAIENGLFRVATGVLVYTTVTHWWQVFLQIFFPLLIRKLRMKLRNQRLCEELRDIELEEEDIMRHVADSMTEELKERAEDVTNRRILLNQAQDDIWLELMRPPHDSFPEYIQAVVLFTYVSCFSVVLPITPLICLFNYLLSMRLDAFKLCKGRRRPLAEKTGGIGIWEHLLHIVAVISVLTNCWLMGFTNGQFIELSKKIGDVGLFALVVAWEHVMLLIKYIMQTSISSLPKSVRNEIKRQQHESNVQRNYTMRVRQGRRSQHQKDGGSKIGECETFDDSVSEMLEPFRPKTNDNDDDADKPGYQSPIPPAQSHWAGDTDRLLFSA